MIPGMPNPADAVKNIADELKQKADDAGMGAADDFIGKLEGIKDQAKGGAGDIIDNVKKGIDEMKDKIQAGLNDPAALAGGGGALAACASWYGGKVCQELKGFSSEVESIGQIMAAQGQAVATPMKQLGTTMESTMEGLGKTVKGLSSLPGQVQALSDSVKGPDDVAKIETGPMSEACDVSGIEGPLNSLGSLKELMMPAVQGIKEAVEKLGDFITNAPDKIKAAFNIPAPLCFLQGALMPNAPPLMTELLSKLEALKSIDLTPFVNMLASLADTIGNLDIESVKKPLTQFGNDAKEKIQDLEKAVQGAKLASNPAGALGGMGKMFG
jgi:hypothetical protein